MGLPDNLFSRRGRRTETNLPPQAQGGKVQPDPVRGNGNGRWIADESYLGSKSGWVPMQVPPSLLGLQNVNPLQKPQCVCQRPSTLVRCENFRCGWSAMGRARVCCANHPNVTFLLDLPQCPTCLGPVREMPQKR